MTLTIRKKIFLAFGILILLSISCQVVFNLFFSKNFFINRKTELMKQSFASIKEAYNEDLTKIDELMVELQEDSGIKVALLINDDVLYTHDSSTTRKKPLIEKEDFEEAEFTNVPNIVIKSARSTKSRTNLQLSGKFIYDNDEVKVLMKLSMASIDNSIALFTETSIYISLVVFVVGLIFSLYVSRTLSNPISSIEQVSKRIAKLDFSSKADESVRTKELSSLAKSINIMSEKLQNTLDQLTEANNELQNDILHQKEIEQQRKDFIANVSHEMKTPLSLLQIYTENLKSDLSDIDRNYYYDTLIEETEKLNKMISRMLEISSIDSGFMRMNYEDFSLTELCSSILYQYSPKFEKHKFETEINENVNVNGDTLYLENSIKNLLNNALEHTAEGGKIKISLKEENGMAVFSVRNQGEQIPEEDLAHIWEAFYRTDKSRTRTTNNNVGLGLYIVKTIIDKHHGNCSVENVKDGVLISISLATAKPLLTADSTEPG